MARIRKGDTVAVLRGRDRGKTGKVLQVWPTQERALVERVNLMKHFERRSQQHPSGGVVEREGSVALSNLTLACPKCHRPVRIGWLVSGDRSKQRICRRCQQPL